MFAPVSGGGLLSGTCLGAKGLRPNIRVFGCEPERADDAYRSITTGVLQAQESSDTIADGLRAALAPRTFAILRKHVDGILLASEEEIISATRLVWERMKIIIEPSSAVAIAPLLRPGRRCRVEPAAQSGRKRCEDRRDFLRRERGPFRSAVLAPRLHARTQPAKTRPASVSACRPLCFRREMLAIPAWRPAAASTARSTA